MTELIIAILGFIGSAFGGIIGIMLNTRLTNYRIEQLEIKVDKHNNLIERTYNLETKEALLEEKIDVANHRIKDLELYNVSKED